MKRKTVSPKTLPEGFMISKWKSRNYGAMKHHHSHPYYEILHTTEGNRIVDTEQGTYLLPNDGVAFFKPGFKHSTSMEKNMKHERYIMNISGHIITEFANFLHIDKNELFSYNARLYSPAQIKIIEKLFDNILLECKTDSSIQKNTALRLYIAQLLVELLKGNPAPERDKDKTDTYDIIVYISQHFTENITLDFISQKFFINKSQLCRTLKNTLGKTFSEFLAELRIDYAKKRLKQTNLTATQISSECGYSNFSYFMRQFKKLTGTTPREYRKHL